MHFIAKTDLTFPSTSDATQQTATTCESLQVYCSDQAFSEWLYTHLKTLANLSVGHSSSPSPCHFSSSINKHSCSTCKILIFSQLPQQTTRLILKPINTPRAPSPLTNSTQNPPSPSSTPGSRPHNRMASTNPRRSAYPLPLSPRAASAHAWST